MYPKDMMDCSPDVVPLKAVDRGSTSSTRPSRDSLGQQLSEDSGQSDHWIDPRPKLDSAGAAIIQGLSNVSDFFKNAIAGAGEPEQLPASEVIRKRQREADCRRLQNEMGFSELQVVEAFKRCSSCEAAIDWILSPEREWNAGASRLNN